MNHDSLASFIFAQQTLPHLIAAGKLHASKSPSVPHPPTLIYTGATASIKGSAQCEEFSPGKFAMRSLAQSLAREFGPQGVHVSHVVIDGVIDIPRAREYLKDIEDGKISPDAV